MLKFIGALFVGAAAVCGIAYLAVKKSGDSQSKQLVDTWSSNLSNSLKKQAASIGAFFTFGTNTEKQPETFVEGAA